MVLVLFTWSVRTAPAQVRAGYPAVFGGTAATPAANASVSLVTSVNVAEAYDNDLLADFGAAPGSGLRLKGLYTSLTPLVSLNARGRRVGFAASGTSNLRRYSDFGSTEATNHNVAAGFSATIGRSTTVLVNEAVSYTPSYLYSLFGDGTSPVPGETIAGAPDYRTTPFRSYSYDSYAALNHSLSPRGTLSVDGSIRRTDFIGGDIGFGDMRWNEFGGRYRYNLSRGLALSVGYSQWESRNSVLQTDTKGLQIGIRYTRPLSPSRRTTLGFDAGPTLAQSALPGGATVGSRGQELRFVGNAFFERDIGRSWMTRATYRRALSPVEGIAAPVYTDTVTVEASGFTSRRIDLLFSAGFATGQTAAGQLATPTRLTTYTGDTHLRFALSRCIAAYVEGLLYNYAFDARLITVPGMPPRFSRTGLRAGVILWSNTKSERHAAR